MTKLNKEQDTKAKMRELTEAEMEAVAGGNPQFKAGLGTGTAQAAGGNPGFETHLEANPPSGVGPGHGKGTAVSAGV